MDDHHHEIHIPTPNNTMQRPRRPSYLILHSSPDISSPLWRLLKTAPCETSSGSLPRLAIQPATGSSLTFTNPSPGLTPSPAPQTSNSLTVSHRSSTASLSTFTGGVINPSSPREEGSNETIRAVETSSLRQQSDFDGVFDEEDEGEPLLRRYLDDEYGAIPRPRARVDGGREGEGGVMHGVWLTVQCFVFLAAVGGLVFMSIWGSEGEDPRFGDWIWTIPQPILLTLTISTFSLLIIHELVGGLSTVALLYLQSGVLVVVTATCLALLMRSFELQDSLEVKAGVVGCVTVVWGWTVLGWMRVAIIWRTEMRREDSIRRFAA